MKRIVKLNFLQNNEIFKILGMSDPEEHFRRSLGKDYQKLNQQSPVEPLAKQILEANVSGKSKRSTFNH